MPFADSRRRQALDGLVTTLALLNGTSYETNASGSGVVSKVIDTYDARKATGNSITMRVRDGEERFSPTFLARGYQAQLRLYIDILILSASAEDMVDQLNDVIRDVHYVIDANRNLGTSGGAIGDSSVESFGTPRYDAEDSAAAVLATVLVTYEYTAGIAGNL